MTDSVFRAVAPVSAVCAAFATQPSAYPLGAKKRTLRQRAGVLRERQAQKETAWRRREKPQSARQDKAAVSCAPRGGHICPRCGQFGDFAEGLLQARK